MSPSNLIYATLPPPSRLSANFKRFYQEFEGNIDFILKWDYEILPNAPTIAKAEAKRLKNKYENLLNQSREMCRRFTGPHSVLQIFLEKIVASISQISETLKDYTIKNLGLWSEVQVAVPSSSTRRAQIGKSSSVLTGHKRSSSADTSLLITKTSKTAASQANQVPQVVQQFVTKLMPKPLLGNIDKYQSFLEQLRAYYLLIIKTCAPKISKHFTKLTAVIIEGTQYEFPSVEIHKSVINKLILNDQKHFKQLVLHVKQEFLQNEAQIREYYPRFAQSYDLFVKEVDEDMRQNQTKIDIYMRDLRKHALVEYNDLYIDEQNQLNAQGALLADSKSKHKRKKRQKKKKDGVEQGQDQAQQQAPPDAEQESNHSAAQKPKKPP